MCGAPTHGVSLDLAKCGAAPSALLGTIHLQYVAEEKRSALGERPRCCLPRLLCWFCRGNDALNLRRDVAKTSRRQHKAAATAVEVLVPVPTCIGSHRVAKRRINTASPWCLGFAVYFLTTSCGILDKRLQGVPMAFGVSGTTSYKHELRYP